MPQRERRAFERVGSRAPLTLVIENNPSLEFAGMTKNISTGSICFETDAPINDGDRVVLRLQTINGPLAVTAVVARKNDNVYGCRFVDVASDVAAKIRSWLFPPFEP